MNPVILACTTMLDYVAYAQQECGTCYPVVELDRLYHRDPNEMRDHIVSTLADLPSEYDTVLVAMGFCGGSWQGITSDKTLVLPRVDDCVTALMTTSDTFCPNTKKAGHMYLIGDGENSFSVRGIYRSLCEQYGSEKADFMFNIWFQNYHYLDIVDTGYYDCYDEAYVSSAQEDADRIHCTLDYTEGSNLLMNKLVSGKWDRQFLVVKPGVSVTQSTMFFDD